MMNRGHGGKMMAADDAAHRARRRIVVLQYAGLSLSEIARRGGIGKSTVAFIARNPKAPISTEVAEKLPAIRG